ncbi:hypothetical protein FACS189475_07820 [Betaproteobacteria bacterium]|nr:hypothetical protein FACS189475_07820 [Betaproteobacteria bacterium]
MKIDLALAYVALQNQGAGGSLGETACAADVAGEGEVIGAVERKISVIFNSAGNAAGVAAVADLQGSVGNGGAAGVAVVGGEDERARAGFGETAARRAGKPAAEFRGIGGFDGGVAG